jgi:hypothetical protein
MTDHIRKAWSNFNSNSFIFSKSFSVSVALTASDAIVRTIGISVFLRRLRKSY